MRKLMLIVIVALLLATPVFAKNDPKYINNKSFAILYKNDFDKPTKFYKTFSVQNQPVFQNGYMIVNSGTYDLLYSPYDLREGFTIVVKLRAIDDSSAYSGCIGVSEYYYGSSSNRNGYSLFYVMHQTRKYNNILELWLGLGDVNRYNYNTAFSQMTIGKWYVIKIKYYNKKFSVYINGTKVFSRENVVFLKPLRYVYVGYFVPTKKYKTTYYDYVYVYYERLLSLSVVI